MFTIDLIDTYLVYYFRIIRYQSITYSYKSCKNLTLKEYNVRNHRYTYLENNL